MGDWQFNKQINLSVLVQIVFLAALIVGSWVNLQNRLNLLQHDVRRLLESNKEYVQKIETLSAKSLEYGYRLQLIEKRLLEKKDTKNSY